MIARDADELELLYRSLARSGPAVLLVPRGIIPTGGEYIRRLTRRGRAAIPAAVPSVPQAPDPAPVQEAQR